ncbi:MAG TPA: alpha-L-arabinofuranosidase C-terminal domain-containing protein [Bacteroidales bacterium]|jgi:alpha-N-arabinofuranosidase|nr:alpha-L-arabinofuranosidase C-terminal domain-containing protein [Bacteroidota bacterium]HNV67526.1 alpha-L-arabinofuranosidase C-terminal domain-containing protein [Bacteroidales bacterium]HPH75686.1 alpha-L-arabinofuranosidase C-terminal domain-containing protein [Bacteroidales bacterium]HPV27297.1 alpha-L-arabinofuranosidase C-terminal domain-containing protein [Bacteroidales bacterium]
MRNLLLIFTAAMFLSSCSGGGVQNTLITNPSAEEGVGSTVTGWIAESGRGGMIAFYDYEAHHGNRSLMLQSNRPSGGRWMTKVELKPWSEYKFTGWVKTEGVESRGGKGAGFRFEAFDAEYTGLTGTNDWQKIEFVFKTGNDDSSILSCLLGLDGPASGRAWFDDMSLELLRSENFNTAVTIDVADKKESMSEYIYGQFIEHLGRCIYGGIWAEMLEDRKFWYLPGDRESPWQVKGKRELFSVDRANPFTGDKTPVLGVDGSGAAGIQQSGLGLKPDLEYEGRIILKATPGITAVKVTLSRGEESQSVTIDKLGTIFSAYPLKYQSGAMTHNASLTIEPEGNGKVWVGTASLMPSDNIEGFRSDVIALLKELNAPVYRWPGGNFVSGYNWKDGIGDRDRRPPRKNPAWQGVEHNDVGLHEFISFCEILGTEPYIAVNAGLGDSKQAREEVEYCNGSAETPMGRLRAANGHPEPWNVKWWSIGNEMYGNWQLGHMSTEDFVRKHNAFADAMRSVDPDIKLIAVGELGDWDRMVLTNCSESMDLISEHFYRQDWHGGGLMTHVKQIPDAIREKAEAHRQYRKEIPQLEGKDIRICMDEWNYWYGPHIYGELGTRYFMRDAMGIAAGLNEYSRQSDMVFMANYAQTVNVIGCIKTNTTSSILDATGQVLKLYRQQFGTIPVAVSGETRPVDIAATLDSEGQTVTISVVNATRDKVKIPVTLLNGTVTGEGELWQVTAPDIMATNEPGRPENVKITGPASVPSVGELTVGPASINLFVFKLKN